MYLKMNIAACNIIILCFVIPHVYSNMGLDPKAISSKIVEFSMKFCNELDKDKSVVSSPLSAEFVLALLTLGTSDPAHSELLTSLGLPNDDSIRSSFTQLSSEQKGVKELTLHVANKIYIKDGSYELFTQFKDDAVRVFDADVEKVDFDNNVAAANLINNWVANKTNNKIQKLLQPDSLDPDARLVLVNAIYFKGNWKKQFSARLTSTQPFFIKKDVVSNVSMMYKEDSYRYMESRFLDAKLLELPYVGNEASFVIVLPNDIEGLESMLQKLASGYNLIGEIEKMYATKVQASIPKFKIETEIDLGQLLPKLGIQAIFNQDDSGLTKLLNNGEKLYVSKAVQKAFIEVNEEGAEAAAATGVLVTRTRSRPQPPKRFRADRPFLYLLVGQNELPIFIGTYRGNP